MKIIRKVVEILSHIVIQIIIFGSIILIVPVGIGIELQRLVLDDAFAHLEDAEHLVVFVRYVGFEGRVNPQPFAQFFGIDFVNDVTIAI